jgi:hypothetical protein
MRLVALLVAILVSGCATQTPAPGFDRSDMANFVPDCGQAQRQVDYLKGRITAFHEYFQSRPVSAEDRKYYTRLKNNLWSLRSSCSVLQR